MIHFYAQKFRYSFVLFWLTFFSLHQFCLSNMALCDGLSRKLKYFTRFAISISAFIYNQKSNDQGWTNTIPKSIIGSNMGDTNYYKAANLFSFGWTPFEWAIYLLHNPISHLFGTLCSPYHRFVRKNDIYHQKQKARTSSHSQLM